MEESKAFLELEKIMKFQIELTKVSASGHDKSIENCKDIKDVKRLLRALFVLLYDDRAYLLQMILYGYKATERAHMALNALPNKEEFDDVRKELETYKQNVVSTLLPIKKMFDEQKAREKRLGEMNGIG